MYDATSVREVRDLMSERVVSPGNSGTRHRSLVLVSTPPACAVCGGTGRVGIVAFPGLAMHGGGTARCPHCSAEQGRAPLPIFIYPLRDDHPRGETA